MTRLSNRQYPMLKAFADEAPGWHMSIEDAHTFDQRPFRSMLINGWVSFAPGKGFFMTKAGREAWHEFGNTHIGRKNPMAPLCSYFENVWGGVSSQVRPTRRPRQTRLPGIQPDTGIDRTRDHAPAIH